MIKNFKIFESKRMNSKFKYFKKYFIDFFNYIDAELDITSDDNGIYLYYNGHYFIDAALTKSNTIYIDIVSDHDFNELEWENWDEGKIIRKFLFQTLNKSMYKLNNNHWILRSYEFKLNNISSVIRDLEDIKDKIKIQIEAEKYNL